METEAQKHHGDYKIIIDHKQHTWREKIITGLQLKNLAGVDPTTYSVWMQVPRAEDPEIADGQQVDLSKPGVEKFFTGKKQTTEG